MRAPRRSSGKAPTIAALAMLAAGCARLGFDARDAPTDAGDLSVDADAGQPSVDADAGQPSIAITQPASGSYVNAAAAAAFSLAGTCCGECGQPVTVSAPGAPPATTACVAGGWVATLDLRALPEGPLTVIATQPGTGPSPATASRLFVKDVTPPSAIAALNDGSFVASLTAHPEIEWTASSDGGSGIARYDYCIGSQGGLDDVQPWQSAGTALQVSIPALNLVEGRLYRASVRAVDNAGNVGPTTTADGWIPDLVTSGLVAHWTFDAPDVANGVVADASGNGNSALLRNAPAFAPGRFGQAIDLNGADQYLDIADSPSLQTTSVTVSAWVRFPNNVAACPGGWCMIFEHARDTSNWYALLKSATPPNDFWHWRWQTGGWGPTATEFGDAIPGHRAVVGTWIHLVAQIDASAARAITYVNNELDVSYQAVTVPVRTAGPSSIGRAANLTEYFQGQIDDLRIYSRVLSSAEVDKLYNLGQR